MPVGPFSFQDRTKREPGPPRGDSGGEGHLYFYDRTHNVVYGTAHRAGTSSLVAKGRLEGWPRLSRKMARKAQDEGAVLFVPMRNPYDRLESAYWNMSVRARYGERIENFWAMARRREDPHVQPLSHLHRKWGMDMDKIQWVHWDDWREMLAQIHNHKSARPGNLELPPDTDKSFREALAEDFEIWERLQETKTGRSPQE